MSKGASRSGGGGALRKVKDQEMAARLKREGVQRPGSTAILPVMEARLRHAMPANFDWTHWKSPW